jgi:ABC-type uncharacterized transport system involved in gliding motility auxiliary subunit
MRRRPFILFVLAAIAVLFVSVNALAGVLLKGARVDLTEGRLYSLSSGSEEVVRALAEPVDLTFYFSRGLAQDYPGIRAYGARVRETLQAFVDRSRGKLRLTILDPEPFSEEEDAAFAAGLQAAPTSDGESIYFGLVARNALDETRIVPFFNPDREPYLEYELTRSVAELMQDSGVKVALVTSLPLEAPGASAVGGPETPRPIHFYEQLLANFDVETMDRDFVTLPEDADVLVLAHPWELDPMQLWAVDQFVLTHGRALVLVDPYSRYSLAPGPTGFPDLDAVRTSDLAPLLAAWGVGYDPRRVVIDRANALVVSVQEEGRRLERAYPLWYDAPPAQLSPEDLATAALARGVVVAAPGAFDALDLEGVTFEPLIETSTDARAIEVEDAVDAAPRDLIEGYAPEGAFTLAARLSGELSTAFPDGPPEDVRDPRNPVLSGRAEIVVVADSDLIDDTFYVTRDPLFGDSTHADNAAFLLNVIDLLSGSDALVSLRSRARSARPLTVLDDMRERAEQALLAEQLDLEAQLDAAETRLRELEAGGVEDDLAGEERLQAEREANDEYLRMREVILDTRARLREIERTHRASIERLQAFVIVLNVWVLPLLVAACGVAVFLMRRRAAGTVS